VLLTRVLAAIDTTSRVSAVITRFALACIRVADTESCLAAHLAALLLVHGAIRIMVLRWRALGALLRFHVALGKLFFGIVAARRGAVCSSVATILTNGITFYTLPFLPVTLLEIFSSIALTLLLTLGFCGIACTSLISRTCRGCFPPLALVSLATLSGELLGADEGVGTSVGWCTGTLHALRHGGGIVLDGGTDAPAALKVGHRRANAFLASRVNVAWVAGNRSIFKLLLRLAKDLQDQVVVVSRIQVGHRREHGGKVALFIGAISAVFAPGHQVHL